MKLTSSKQGYHLRRNMVIASGVEKKDTSQEIAKKIKRNDSEPFKSISDASHHLY